MLTCRSIPPALWESARQSLVFYFSRRCGLRNAEDLAQDTLIAILSREDYDFEVEADFLRVCYGFAHHVLQTAKRKASKEPHSIERLVVAQLQAEYQGLRGAELTVYLTELLRVGKESLREADWRAVQTAMNGEPAKSKAADGNALRVRLHRARKKLAALVHRHET